MNNIKLTVTIPSLSFLTPVGTDTYELVAKLFKPDGTPLDSPYVDNVQTLTITTLLTTFDLNLLVDNETYSHLNTELKLYANNDDNCCFGSQDFDLINTKTVVSTEAVLLSQLGSGGKVYKYEPTDNEIEDIFSSVNSPDIAHTATKLFVYGQASVGGDSVLRIQEHNITLDPFTHSFVRNYDLDADMDGAGLCAVSNTKLFIAGVDVTEINISGTVATPTLVFSFASGYSCTGDLIYDTVTELFLILYDNGADYRVGVFERDGTIVRSEVTPVTNMFGIYQFGGDTFVIDGSGQIYELDLTTLDTTIDFDLNMPISGGSQIQSNISIPA